jgi:hypothetical protein
MMKNKKDILLPPRPGEKPLEKEIKGIPIDIYINGQPVRMSKQEALGVMSQILNILCYLDQQENSR